MARKTKFIYKYNPRYSVRDFHFVVIVMICGVYVRDFSKFGVISGVVSLLIFGFTAIRLYNRNRYSPTEYTVYNTGVSFPHVGLFMDSPEYANFKDIEKIEQIDDYLTIKLKGGKFYEIPLKRISYVGRLSFAKELMEMKKSYDDYRKRRRTVNRRKRQAKRLERQKQQAA